jgi:hypothetical protein
MMLIALIALRLTLTPWLAVQAPADQAEVLIREGVQLRRNGDDLSALPLFEHAFATFRSPRTAGQLGLVEQSLGRWASAQEHMAEALRSLSDPWIRQNRSVLEKSMFEIRKHVGSIEVLGEPERAEVLVNGRFVGRLPLAHPVGVAAGAVIVEVRADGFLAASRNLDVTAGQFRSVVVRLDRAAEKPASSVSMAVGPSPRAAPSSTGWLRPAAWAGLATGGALLTGGIAANIVRQSKASEFENRGCAEGPGGSVVGPATCPGLRDDYRRANLFTWTGYVAGGALAVTSLIFLLTSSSAEGSDDTHAGPVCGPGKQVASLSCRIAF